MSVTVKQNKIGKMAGWSALVIILMLALPLIPYAIGPDKPANDVYTTKVDNPGSDLWRDVRQRDKQVVGNTQMRNMNAGTLIDENGQQWREYRMTQLIPYSGYLFGLVLLGIGLFWLSVGRIPIHAGRSDRKILRFSLNQRTAHWVVAIMFVLLGITGITLLYGRFILIPVLGADGFGITAQIAKTIHDYVGPAFGIALIIQFFLFIRGNSFDLKTDINWLMKGGGMLGGQHVSAGCYNAGEKIWFWIAMLGGAVLIVSGVILDFPFFNQDRGMLELNHMIHSIAAVVIVAVSFGHIYIGTAGMEGAFDAMYTGYCDENWAKEHHEIWFNNMQKSAAGKPSAQSSSPGTGEQAT